MELDIVNLIESPTSRLTGEYKSKLLNNIKNNFSAYEQQLFLAFNYANSNYTNEDFVIKLDDIWKWLGYSRLDHCKKILIKYLIENEDYKVIQKDGYNKQFVFLTVNGFKKLCLKSQTKKADEIQNYYTKLQYISMRTIMEETDELTSLKIGKEK